MNHLRSTALSIANDYFESNDPTLLDRYVRTHCRMVKKANELIELKKQIEEYQTYLKTLQYDIHDERIDHIIRTYVQKAKRMATYMRKKSSYLCRLRQKMNELQELTYASIYASR
jgi:hypothetical protein